MTKLIVMIIMISGQGSPTVIQGWSSIAACNNAKPSVEAFFKTPHGGRPMSLLIRSVLSFRTPSRQPAQHELRMLVFSEFGKTTHVK